MYSSVSLSSWDFFFFFLGSSHHVSVKRIFWLLLLLQRKQLLSQRGPLQKNKTHEMRWIIRIKHLRMLIYVTGEFLLNLTIKKQFLFTWN